jgi:hypothetical protein
MFEDLHVGRLDLYRLNFALVTLIPKKQDCDRTPLKKQGFVSQDHIGQFSMKREYTNTTRKHTIPQYSSYKIIITY